MIIKFTKSQEQNKHKFTAVADEWASEAFPLLAYRTLSCYQSPLKRAKQFFISENIEDITHSKIKKYMEYLAEQNFGKKTKITGKQAKSMKSVDTMCCA